MVIETINGIGHTVVQTVSGFLRINHFVGEKALQALSEILRHARAAAISLMTAVYVALEDFGVFIAESVDMVVNAAELTFACFDAILSSAARGCSVVGSNVTDVFSGIHCGIGSFLQAIVYLYERLGHLLAVFWSSLLLLLGIFPRTVYFLYCSTASLLLTSSAWISTLAHQAAEKASLETVLCFLGTLLFLASCRRLVQRSRVSFTQLVHLLLQLVYLAYFYSMRTLIFGARCVIKLVELTLSHLHVTRFHNAGDSGAEDDADADRDRDLVSVYDESDDAENERVNDKRRNYDLLLKRRLERRQQLARKRSRKKAGGGRCDEDVDVEELLFEQVEREREDKLCVVCQDKEKCIMILPCRHLCICQDCQQPLRLQNNRCPICRRVVRQVIKAYL